MATRRNANGAGEASVPPARLRAKLTPAQIAEAQRMAREWMQSHPSKR